MFLFVVGTHTKCVIIEFALDARTDILIFPCHTVTNGIDLRRSPPLVLCLQWMTCCSNSFPPTLSPVPLLILGFYSLFTLALLVSN